MAVVNRMVSDLTGEEAPKESFGRMVVRRHPKLDEPKELDYLLNEMDGAKPIAEVVVVELTAPDGTESELLMTPGEFAKLFKGQDMMAALTNARGTKGRRPKVT